MEENESELTFNQITPEEAQRRMIAKRVKKLRNAIRTYLVWDNQFNILATEKQKKWAGEAFAGLNHLVDSLEGDND